MGNTSMNAPPTPIAIAVVEHQGRFLIGRRGKDAALAGLWEFPGGKIQPGESAQEAAARECREETGLEVDVGDSYGEIIHRYEHANVQLYFFACTLRQGPEEPRSPFRWIARRELTQFDFPAANADLIARLAASTD